jgi:sugar phosphate isomerase/epimerase
LTIGSLRRIQRLRSLPSAVRWTASREVPAVHGRRAVILSVSAVSSWQQSFDDDRAMWERLGVRDVGLSLRKCEEVGWPRVRDAIDRDGLHVTNVVECGWFDLHDRASWSSTRTRWIAATDALAAASPWSLVVTSGPAWQVPSWPERVSRLGEALAPVVAHARARGVTVALEHTGSLRVDLSFVHRLRDAIAAAEHLDVGVCVELSSCWSERDVETLLAHPRVAHVQLSDVALPSQCTPDRAVPGDGDVPLGRLLGALERADYRGAVELEMAGPRIEAEGYESAIRRALDWWSLRDSR